MPDIIPVFTNEYYQIGFLIFILLHSAIKKGECGIRFVFLIDFDALSRMKT